MSNFTDGKKNWNNNIKPAKKKCSLFSRKSEEEFQYIIKNTHSK